MRKVLHITGNRNTTEQLKKIEKKAEIITWNEMLCDGKTLTDVGSERFWKSRYSFFKNQYNAEKSSFINNILKEYRNLCSQNVQEEVVLWFGDDLQNQINMIAVISWLKKYRKNIHIWWIGNLTDKFTQEDLRINYESRVSLSQDDVEYADYIWQLYCSNSPLSLEMHLKNSQTNLTALPSVLALHLKRFPSVKNGLNIIENEIITEASLFQGDKTMFVNHLVEKYTDFGYNAMQFEVILDKLKSLFHSVNPLKINAQGEEVIRNTINMYPVLRNEHEYLGGSLKYDFLYYDASGKILKL